MKKVLIPTKLDPIARELLEKRDDYVVVQEEGRDLADLAAEHKDAHAVIVRSEKVDEAVISALPQLKVVVRAGAGYNTIDTKFARSKGVDVMNTPGANANAVAEEVVALMLADARHVIAADASTRSGKWEKKNFMGRELAGKTIGILGLGAIGRLLVKRLSGFDVNILGYDPMLSEDRAREMKVTLTTVPELFAEADYISLHIPENDDTRGMVNAELLAGVKSGVTIINCARAGVINEDDLRAVKAEKNIRFLNDVYPKDAAGDKPIADIADIMLPHLGASTKEANYNAARRSAEQLIELDEKGITSYVVNRDIPEGLDEAFGELAYTLTKLCRSVLGDKAQLKQVETSFYGSLKPYAKWLAVPVVSALHKDFDRSMNHQAAVTYLNEHGVEYVDRETDDLKGYENSITVDLIGNLDDQKLTKASVRGTVAESILMVSRINDFDKLFFEPKGPTVIFAYPDKPGVLGQIGVALAKANINIDDVRNPHDIKGETSVAVIKVNQPVPGEVIAAIAQEINAKASCYVEL